MKITVATQDYKNQKFNLTKEGSDFSTNQIVLNSLIGTLVKYGASGRLEPYLAQSWEVSSDKRVWKFKLRENLIAENGSKISSESFYNVLVQNLKEYSKKQNVMIFNKLLGWSEFSNNQESFLAGLSFDSGHLIFSFDSKPDELLEVLQMPYFGYWLEDDNGKIVSTSAYKLALQSEGRILLGLRSDWFNAQEKSPKSIEITFSQINEIKNKHYELIQMPFTADSTVKIDNYYWITNTPTLLDTFVLSPYKNSFFNRIENRILFSKRIQEIQDRFKLSKFFYPTAASILPSLETPERYIKPNGNESLTFAIERTNYSNEEFERLNAIIKHALEGSGLDFKILTNENNDPDWYKKTDSNEYFDARISSVDIGAYPLYTAIEMMFCTNLGVSFPDYDEKICHLLNHYSSNGLEINKEFISDFNNIIHSQSIIIPIHHHSKKWLVANKVNPRSLPATSLLPLFELIEFN